MKKLDNLKTFEEYIFEEDGGGAVATGSGNTGSGSDGGGNSVSGGGGTAYATAGTVDGMGPVTNAQPGENPGQTGKSGSGDVNVPLFTYTKNSGKTGNKKVKMGHMKTKGLDSKPKSQPKSKKKEKEVDVTKVNKINDIDNLNKSKVMSYQKFVSMN